MQRGFHRLGAALAAALVAGAVMGEVAERLRVGPFYERCVMADGSSFTAVRPFYSRGADAAADEAVTDVLWPLATFHRNGERAWWRALLAFGDDLDARDAGSAWSFGVFPLWFQGRSRLGEDYWALFPLYGNIPRFYLMEDLSFALFPCYLRYRVAERARAYYLWPVVSRLEDEVGEMRTSVFPLYGHKDTPREETRYVLWPLWVDTVYKEATGNAGSAWALFPVAGQVAREHERQWMAVPPLVSHARTATAERWHLPWPFVQVEESAGRRSRVFWPVYGDRVSEDSRRFTGGWFLFSREDTRTRDGRVARTRVFPFYAREATYTRDADGGEREVERYLRVWPLFTHVRRPGVSHFRTLELSPVRHAGGIERNWAPFWTLYERSELGGEVEHDALWGVLNFRLRAGRGQPEEGEEGP